MWVEAALVDWMAMVRRHSGAERADELTVFPRRHKSTSSHFLGDVGLSGCARLVPGRQSAPSGSLGSARADGIEVERDRRRFMGIRVDEAMESSIAGARCF